MDNNEIIDYVMQTPSNSNPNVMRGILEKNSGSSEWREATDEDYEEHNIEFNATWKSKMVGYINEKSKLMYFRNNAAVNFPRQGGTITTFTYITNLGDIKPIVEKASVNAYNTQDVMYYPYAVATFLAGSGANVSITSSLLNTDSARNGLFISLLAAF